MDVVEDLEAVDELGHLLRKVQPRQHVSIEPIFHLEIACKVDVIEFVKLVLHFVLRPLLHISEVLLVSKLTEVLSQNILKVVQHSRHGANLIRVDL